MKGFHAGYSLVTINNILNQKNDNYIFVKYKTNEELENRFFQYRQNPRNVHISWVCKPANFRNQELLLIYQISLIN